MLAAVRANQVAAAPWGSLPPRAPGPAAAAQQDSLAHQRAIDTAAGRGLAVDKSEMRTQLAAMAAGMAAHIGALVAVPR
jgi:hypothetical protein